MLFAASPSSGHPLAFDDRSSNQGGSPVETILSALGACSAMDVISIATKKRQAVDGVRDPRHRQPARRVPAGLHRDRRRPRGDRHEPVRGGHPARHRAVGDEVLPGQRDGQRRRDRRPPPLRHPLDRRDAVRGRPARSSRPARTPGRTSSRISADAGVIPSNLVGFVWYAAGSGPRTRRTPHQRGPDPDAVRHPHRRHRPPAEGADDRPAWSPVRGRRLGDPADRGLPDEPAVARGRSCSLSIGVSAAFGLRYSIYGAIWRRIVKVAHLGPAEPEHEYPPRFAQVLGSVALTLSLLAFLVGATTLGLGLRPRRRRAPDAARDDRLLPRLPAVLPALVGPGHGHPDLDPRRLERQPPRRGADPLRVTVAVA